MGQNAPAGRPLFFLQLSKPRRVRWNSVDFRQKCRHPTTQRAMGLPQGGWGRIRRSPPIDIHLKCLTHRTTNAIGSAMCEAFSLESSVAPWANLSPPKAPRVAKNQPMMANEAQWLRFIPFRASFAATTPPDLSISPSCRSPSSSSFISWTISTVADDSKPRSRRATDDGR